MVWDALIDWIRAGILTLAQLFGGNLGLGILAASTLLRLSLLPLTMHLGRRALRQQAILARLQPQIARIRARHADQPERVVRDTLALYRREGYKPLDWVSLLGNLVQLPLLGAFFAALRNGFTRGLRFFWVPDLARPDFALATLAALVTGLGVYLGIVAAPATPAKAFGAVLTISLISVFTAAWLGGAGFALSMIGTGVVNSVQSLLLARGRTRAV